MQAVLLDAASLGADIDLSPIEARVSRLTCHDATSAEHVVPRLDQADVAIVNKVVLDAASLEALPRLKLICVLATGTNNIDMQAAERLGIQVRNVVGYGTASVAQHSLLLLLALAARLPLYQEDVRSGRWSASPFFCLMDHPTMQLDGRHLVIVGQGELGRRVGQLAAGLGMQVSYAARPGREAGDSRPALHELAAGADVISLHCPLTDATQHLIDETLLARLKPSTLIINCARGGIIDERACLAALQAGRLGGLGVDVLPEEPPRNGHPLLEALGEPLNLIVTPHNAWISPEARQRIVSLTADNLDAWIATR
ncbi:D-2-hydroxyacid dehydrogenase [Halomonas sp. 18H]|uniref:D-2-hydroxyacid dehydrogenase n=1 Tax=Halomonas almeriensis TaxID=308163 RepID=UPI002231096F|nr:MULTISPECIES: D-2-hydroxyacid dehydrogenase [Halomonas]MCW4151835.1 D-2-hydroxyacid dehydrogenase [Halomonas sp. 18H]MDN3554081.1 D-2-hydroxyacid dehydrogenase [Halomonas almeriensis]